jgi:hypothetical protein
LLVHPTHHILLHLRPSDHFLATFTSNPLPTTAWRRRCE